jgi:Na+/proline symporter
MVPSGLAAVGGFSGMREVLPPEFFTLYSEVSGLTGFTIAMLAVNGIIGISAQPHMVAMCATGNTERAGRVGQTYGSLVKRVTTVGWALTGLIVAALVIQTGTELPDPEHAFGYAARVLLSPGLTGLLVAAVLAANMSTCSNFMVNTGALFTRNFYLKYFSPNATDERVLRAGRLSGLALTLCGVLFALTIDNVLHAFLFTETIAAFMGIMVVGGHLWRRANRYGALSGVLLTFSVYYYLNHNAAGELMLVYTWQPEPFGWAMLAGALGFVLVSLFTPTEPETRVASFFERMGRASDEPENPSADSVGKALIMLDAPGWFSASRWSNFWSRYREDALGFLLAWGVVILLILGAWGLMQVG